MGGLRPVRNIHIGAMSVDGLYEIFPKQLLHMYTSGHHSWRALSTGVPEISYNS